MTKRSRWLLTINNPAESDFTHDTIKAEVCFLPCIYCCMSDEVGESGNYHTHVYIICSSCITFATLKKSFPTAHIDPAYGTANEVKDYVFKTGKWLEDKKAETNIRDTHFEYGILPNDSKIEEKRIDRRKLYNLVKDGYTNSEILKLDFEYFPYLEAVQRMRLMIKSELSNKSGQESTAL